MTVEELIELLQRELPQALVKIKSDLAFHIDPLAPGGRDVLYPYRLRTTSRDGYVYILCSLYSP